MSRAEQIFDAIAAGDFDEMKKLMEADHLLVNAVGTENLTPLHVAAREGHRDMVLWLVAHGADLDAVDSTHGASPLGWAAYYARAEAVDALVAGGAAVGHKNAYGETPLQVAQDGLQGKWLPYTQIDAKAYEPVVELLKRHAT